MYDIDSRFLKDCQERLVGIDPDRKCSDEECRARMLIDWLSESTQ